ncbi:MAG: sigma-54-dependent Fis family transcriptional regulator [Planctomycetes bacterium]|nr:sigma-54-dependent Fis family transcriptional regulator [Planctomycetota bacterium]MCB9902794.1 sigma-54-dependent Fis family transcriptional regulator [Planctomycetota bacterium]
MTHRILLASSDPQQTSLVRRGLEGSGVALSVATAAAEVPRLIDRERIATLVIDLSLEGDQGAQLLERVTAALPDLPVVVLAEADRAATALRDGAVDFVGRDETGLRLRTALRNALTQGRMRTELRDAARSQRTDRGLATLIGRAPALLRAKELLERAAQKDVAVLLVGETGTGKERAARAVHAESDRATRPFVAVRCGSLPANSLGVELFGERDGHAGAFEEAEGGTVYLDHVECLSTEHQARLLEVLQESYVRRMGDPRSIPVDVRVIASTTHDPARWTAHGLREDLQYRLGVFPIQLPPLRERTEDLELLALAGLKRFAKQHGKSVKSIDAGALQVLATHDWPGNLPELESAIERATLVANGDVVKASMLPKNVISAIAPDGDASALRLIDDQDPLARLSASDEVRPFEEQEKRILVHALKSTQWNVLETARRLRIGRATVYRKIERFGLSRSAGRSVI